MILNLSKWPWLKSHETQSGHKQSFNVCFMILTKGQLSKFKVTERKSAKYVSGPYISQNEALKILTAQRLLTT